MPATSQQRGQEAFGAAVRSGEYPRDLVPEEPARRFFASVLGSAASFDSARPLRVLECGCGSGFWLAEVVRLAGGREIALHGFDLTPQMVGGARARLAGLVPPERVRLGDVLDPGAYAFAGSTVRFDLVYAYDVVQQIPPARHLEACTTMLAHLAPRGTLVIFDHECNSIHGARMALKKLITRRLGIPLVPAYYCAARYPSLRRLVRLLAARGRAAEIRRSPSIAKRALVVR